MTERDVSVRNVSGRTLESGRARRRVERAAAPVLATSESRLAADSSSTNDARLLELPKLRSEDIEKDIDIMVECGGVGVREVRGCGDRGTSATEGPDRTGGSQAGYRTGGSRKAYNGRARWLWAGRVG